jgi:hypothetical protein
MITTISTILFYLLSLGSFDGSLSLFLFLFVFFSFPQPCSIDFWRTFPSRSRTITAPHSLPPFPASQKDGYAVFSKDFAPLSTGMMHSFLLFQKNFGIVSCHSWLDFIFLHHEFQSSGEHRSVTLMLLDKRVHAGSDPNPKDLVVVPGTCAYSGIC